MISFSEQNAGIQFASARCAEAGRDLANFAKPYLHEIYVSPDHGFDVRFDGVCLCQVIGGQVLVRCFDKALFWLERGDVFTLSEFLNPETGLNLSCEDNATLLMLNTKDALMCQSNSSLFDEKLSAWQSRFKQWLMVVLAQHVQPVRQPKTGFTRYENGADIVVEGDDAPFVYTLLEGEAEVFANGVKVGDVGTDEIFGAMAALANSKRTATVRAKGSCMVMIVSREEFYLLVNSHPQLFVNLLKDMARVIVSLNEQVVSLKGR